MDYRVDATEWTVDYLGQQIGRIRRRRDGFHAKLADELLGVYPSGDAAAEAVWRRYVERSAAQHEQASVMHGGRERHR